MIKAHNEYKYGKGKVSIVLPVYNGEHTLNLAIDSIISQTYSNLELIIVNDCSTDGTEGIIKKYAEIDSRIVIINNSANLKLPNSLNIGFEHATGDYLTWTSDDNIYKEDAIQKMIAFLQRDKNIDMVYADYTQIDEEGKVLDSLVLSNIDMLPFGNMIGACFLYKRDIAELVGKYDSDTFLAEDYDYWIRMWKIGNIVHLNENLYYYRRHAGSLTETKQDLIQLQTYKVLEKHFLFLYSTLSSETQKKRFFDHIMYRAGYDETIRKRLYCINKKYLYYVKKKALLIWMLEFLPVKILRRIKNKLCTIVIQE